MLDFINNTIWTIKNVLTVVSRELLELNIDIFIYIAIRGIIVFAMFYFPSKWFRAYLFRLFLFIIGIIVFLSVCHKSTIIFSLDLYASIGIFLPHIEIVEITYLILRERTLFIYDKITELFLIIIRPFIWIYNISTKIFQYFKIKQEQRENKKAKNKYYQDEFKREQEKAYKQEQDRYDENDKKNQKKNNKKQKQYYYNKKEKTEKNRDNIYSRWNSSNPYEVLGINENASKQEIKKAYRNLSKIYHPDLTLFDKEKNTIIFQKINGAYEVIK